jgi:twitching motility two-component system response regulator PilG
MRGGAVAEEATETSLAGIKVMVIDDSKTIRRTAETLLKKAGCDVVTATDGFEALAKITDQNPDVIFIDIMMPRLDGYQTCALIKNNHINNELFY